MEKWQKDYIDENAGDLLEFINSSNQIFLSKFTIMNIAERHKLNSIADLIERNQKLLEIVRTKDGGYSVLCKALSDTNQTGALKILVEGYKQNGIEVPAEIPSSSGGAQGGVKNPTVGEKGCSANDIVNAMKDSASFSQLHSKWKSLARNLDVPDETIDDLDEKRLLRNTYGLSDVVVDVLKAWRLAAGDEAKVKILTDALRSDGLTDIAQPVERKFL